MDKPIGHRYELAVESSEPDETIVKSILRNYNKAANPIWWEKLDDPANEPQLLNAFVFDDSDNLIGGVLGETCLSWLKVFIMAVREDRRGQGIGSGLIAFVEDEAIRRGCKYAFLDTLEYQAPEFYKRLGYEVATAIPDWDSHGHAKYFFTKQLDSR